MKSLYTEFDDQYLAEAKNIVNLIKKDFVLDDGALAISRQGDNLKNKHIWPDLGDFLVFFLVFGEEEFVYKQINLLQASLKNDLLISEFPGWKMKGLAKSYEYSDYLLGLMDLYEYRKEDQFRELLKKNADKAIKIFSYDKSFSSFFWSRFGWRLPLVDTRDGMMIEIFTELSETLDDEKYFDVAKNIYSQLVSSSFYKEHNIFPTYVAKQGLVKFSGKEKFSQGEITKNNINTLYGMLSLYQRTKDSSILDNINNTIETIFSKATIDGGVVKTFSPNSKNSEAFLTSSFAIIDFLCDLYDELKQESDLAKAKQVANYWLKLQGQTGLFPLTSNDKQSFLDSETDMCVALYKLAELSDEKKYSEAADKCFEGISKYHKPKNYVSGVDVNSGELINNNQKTKFLALHIKLLVLKYEQSQGNKIYSDKQLFNFLRDR